MKIRLLLLLIFINFSAQLKANTIGYLNNVAEVGMAYYSAANLKGSLTSYGEKYDDSQLTASHSTYPLNTFLKVTNLENNLIVQVRINDHCTCDKDHEIIGISREATSKLGMVGSRRAIVKLEVVSQPTTEKVKDIATANLLSKDRAVFAKEEIKELTPAIDALPKKSDETFLVNHTYDIAGSEKNPKGFGVQLAALTNLNMVQYLSDELLKVGVKKDEIYLQISEKDQVKIYRLVVGEFSKKAEANEKLTWLSQLGFKGIIRPHIIL